MAQEKCTPLRFSARPPPLSLSCLRRLPYRAHFVRTPAPLPTTGTKPSGVPRRVPTHQRVLQTIGYLSEHLPLRRLWWLFSVDIPEPFSLSLVISRRSNQPTSSNSPPLLDSMPRVTPPRSPRAETAQAAASGADSVDSSAVPTPDQRPEPAVEPSQAAAPRAGSLGAGIQEPEEVEVTTLRDLGPQGADALNLYLDTQGHQPLPQARVQTAQSGLEQPQKLIPVQRSSHRP